MGIKVAYGSKGNISDAIRNKIIPTDSIIIAKNREQDSELLFLDAESKLKQLVLTERFAR